MKKRCPFCLTEMDIPEEVGRGVHCRCGAYGQVSLLSDAYSFVQGAKKALCIDMTQAGRLMEVVDGGVVFEEKGESAIIQWAKKPQPSR